MSSGPWDPEVMEQAIPLVQRRIEQEQPKDNTPPVPLSREDRKAWTGDRFSTKEGGEIDRSDTLWWIACGVARGLVDSPLSNNTKRGVIERAVADRDTALGYLKYADRSDPSQQYRTLAKRAIDEVAQEVKLRARSKGQSVKLNVRDDEDQGSYPLTEDPENPLLSELVNLAEVIENGIEPPAELEPGILLKGRVHHIFAPASVGKTFLGLWLAAQRLNRGQRVLYLDTENGIRIISERLELLGVDTQAIRDHLRYLPFPLLDMSPQSLKNYVALIEAVKPILVIFDSWIKFLSSAGLEENDNDHIAQWSTHFLHPLRNAGIASLVLDHVPHDGARSRGASRKRDEVDVQYGLIKTSHFDRKTVGEVKLKLEKDREGWLPASTTFSIGGGDEGFVCSRSGGTIDDPGSIVMKTTEKEALDVLIERFGLSGARHNEWRDECVPKKMSKTSFGRARDELIRVHLVRKAGEPNGPRYFPRDDGGGSADDGPGKEPLISLIPDRVQEGPSRVHGPEGKQEGPEDPHPLRGGSMDPTPAPDPSLVEEDLVERVKQAVEFGNAPKKALEHYRNGGPDIDSVVKSVMRYFGRDKDELQRWQDAVIGVVDEISSGEMEEGYRHE